MPLVGTALATTASAAPGTAFPPRRDWRLDPRRFGRLVRHWEPEPEPEPEPAVPVPPGRSAASDLRLFAITFFAGFLFVSVLLA